MKFVDEFREPELIRRTARRRSAASPIRRATTGSWRSAAATPTPSIASASRTCCPDNIELIHGPGCPVCVLPMGRIDDGLSIADAATTSS